MSGIPPPRKVAWRTTVPTPFLWGTFNPGGVTLARDTAAGAVISRPWRVHRLLAWLASGLAERGAIGAAVDHPGSTFRDLDPARSLLHGQRVRDLKAVVDAFLAESLLGLSIDTYSFYAASFSYGGWTALSKGGLTGDLEGCRRHCIEVDSASSKLLGDEAMISVTLATDIR